MYIRARTSGNIRFSRLGGARRQDLRFDRKVRLAACMASATRDALSALVGASRHEKKSRGPALEWRALHRPSKKRHALDIARSAITPRAVARCRGVRRGADAE